MARECRSVFSILLLQPQNVVHREGKENPPAFCFQAGLPVDGTHHGNLILFGNQYGDDLFLRLKGKPQKILVVFIAHAAGQNHRSALGAGSPRSFSLLGESAMYPYLYPPRCIPA